MRRSESCVSLPLRKDHDRSFRRILRPERITPLPELVDCLWEGGGYGARRDRQPFRFQAFVPDPIADWDRPLAGRAAEAVARATAALSELQAAGSGHDLEAIATTLLRAEALGSSFIEGLRASNKRLALAAYEPVAADSNGTSRARQRPSDGTRDRDRHRAPPAPTRRRARHPPDTARRHDRGAICRSRAHGPELDRRARHEPPRRRLHPSPADRVPALLDDLVAFVNLDDLPAISQAAIAHAQFETIHPFGDGNGRAGRCLIHVILRRRGVAPRLVPPISVVLATNAKRYIAGLTDFREGRTDDWIGGFADTVTAAARSTELLRTQIDGLLDELIERAGSPRSDSVARRIILGLPQQPVVSAEVAASAYGVTPTAARAALNRLQETGVLVPTRVGSPT